MDLSNLIKTTVKKSKRIGRGYGSGKGGHTSSKGAKGQKVRAGGKTKLFFSGTKSNKDFFRQTPWLRGKNRLKSHIADQVILHLSQLVVFENGAVVDAKSLISKKLISEKAMAEFGVKILFDKKIDKKLDIQVPASKSVIAACK